MSRVLSPFFLDFFIFVNVATPRSALLTFFPESAMAKNWYSLGAGNRVRMHFWCGAELKTFRIYGEHIPFLALNCLFKDTGSRWKERGNSIKGSFGHVFVSPSLSQRKSHRSRSFKDEDAAAKRNFN